MRQREIVVWLRTTCQNSRPLYRSHHDTFYQNSSTGIDINPPIHKMSQKIAYEYKSSSSSSAAGAAPLAPPGPELVGNAKLASDPPPDVTFALACCKF